MSNTSPATPAPTRAATPETPARRMDYVAAVLSYLIPGLGQISQGRVTKGLLFLVCLYALFFYGMKLGSWQNVYIPSYNRDPNTNDFVRVTNDVVWSRTQYLGQFPIGIVAWPAIYQYCVYEDNPGRLRLSGFMRAPSAETINELQRDGDKTWDLGWVYTVIAGVLNILVIYDALAGPAFRVGVAKPQGSSPQTASTSAAAKS